jgi:hypothetical protein
VDDQSHNNNNNDDNDNDDKHKKGEIDASCRTTTVQVASIGRCKSKSCITISQSLLYRHRRSTLGYHWSMPLPLDTAPTRSSASEYNTASSDGHDTTATTTTIITTERRKSNVRPNRAKANGLFPRAFAPPALGSSCCAFLSFSVPAPPHHTHWPM